ncbi:hypothetical protein COCVIDRAFT_14640 [Bipolaris victoriae FI3]|uniref:Uncharacterized protein n=1 Tax=Bipolaris victoriae (strain FI3) TaxID=930091 RepID=W7EKN5_BIPV3|nr:hypothetical protein COCVIDRAFT_14640 [Bipolaris victoriae FI3]
MSETAAGLSNWLSTTALAWGLVCMIERHEDVAREHADIQRRVDETKTLLRTAGTAIVKRSSKMWEQWDKCCSLAFSFFFEHVEKVPYAYVDFASQLYEYLKLPDVPVEFDFHSEDTDNVVALYEAGRAASYTNHRSSIFPSVFCYMLVQRATQSMPIPPTQPVPIPSLQPASIPSQQPAPDPSPERGLVPPLHPRRVSSQQRSLVPPLQRGLAPPLQRKFILSLQPALASPKQAAPAIDQEHPKDQSS